MRNVIISLCACNFPSNINNKPHTHVNKSLGLYHFHPVVKLFLYFPLNVNKKSFNEGLLLFQTVLASNYM